MTDRVLSLARMARRLGVTQRWLRAEADADRLPHLRAGKRYLFCPDAVETAIASQAAEDRTPRTGREVTR